MTIIHAMTPLPRLVGDALRERLRVMPAVVVTGARQTGKSTLVRQLVPGRRRYHSVDDLDTRDAARRDPEALVGGTDPVTLDEVQREPTGRASGWVGGNRHLAREDRVGEQDHSGHQHPRIKHRACLPAAR
jgi:predicted AAA+ superfamily ATPase